jgi:hypothetical protein
MLKYFISVLSVFVCVGLHAARAAEPMDLFETERQAIQHCGRDAAVWLVVPKSTYWRKGETGYGIGHDGGYTCQKDAEHASNRHVGTPSKRSNRR